jgi:hypothetical protein
LISKAHRKNATRTQAGKECDQSQYIFDDSSKKYSALNFLGGGNTVEGKYYRAACAAE